MSAQSDKSKKELSDKELAQATGGADIDGGGGIRAESPNATVPTTGWVDEEGVFHPGENPSSVEPSTSVGLPPMPNEEGGPF
jgi:hypothetical protein